MQYSNAHVLWIYAKQHNALLDSFFEFGCHRADVSIELTINSSQNAKSFDESSLHMKIKRG